MRFTGGNHPSRGGREVWLNPSNSITVAPNAAAVAAGVQLAMQKLQSGEFDRQAIRDETLNLQHDFQDVFVDKIQSVVDGILSLHDRSGMGHFCARSFFVEHGFQHKLGLS